MSFNHAKSEPWRHSTTHLRPCVIQNENSNLVAGLNRVNKCLSLILVRHFFQTSSAGDAAANQIDVYEDLVIFRKFVLPLADAVIKRMQKAQKHLWYCSPEFVPFSLTSPNVPPMAKQQLAAAIYSQPRNKLKPGVVEMSPLKPGATLASRVTFQSPYFFEALGIGMGFLDEPV